MIYFFADNHYDARPGFHLYEKIKNDYNINFFEDDISALADKNFPKECDLLMLNLICGTGKLGIPGKEIEKLLKEYCKSGKPIFLIHAGSAAFWRWDWWRKLVGLRWVRENDPDGVPPSVHPVKDFKVTTASGKHELLKGLKGFELKNDEIYTKLQQAQPVEVLLETTIEEGAFPMACVSKNEWNGTMLGFLPGHRRESFENTELIYDVNAMINYALKWD
jgi:hypothetical protein